MSQMTFKGVTVYKVLMCWVLCALTSAVVAQTPAPAIGVTNVVCKVLDPELSGLSYEGPCVGGLAHGQGRVLPKGEKSSSYQGGFEAGRKHGFGRKAFANGDVYEGQWQHDLRTGWGRYVFGASSPWAGDAYEGQWLNDTMHGQGTYQWFRNETYSGLWFKGRPANEGTGGQARRAAYLAAFMGELGRTKGRVCAVAGAVNDPVRESVGWVKELVADRILLEWPDGRGRSWQLVSHWYPCSAQL